MVNKRCGCGAECSCTFESGPGTHEVTPIGGADFGIALNEGTTVVTVQDSDYFDFTIAGNGTSATPYTITAVKQPGAPNPGMAMDRRDFTTQGTSIWTKPFADGWAEVIVHGAGGGGQGSYMGASPHPGSGGGGGGLSRRLIPLDDLPATVTVTVGKGGGGGFGAPDTGSVGGDGANGENSSFGSYVFAGGGEGGLSAYFGITGAHGGYGTDMGGDGTSPFAFNVTDPQYVWGFANTALASSGGGAGGWPSTVEPGISNVDARNGRNGGQIYGGGFHLYGVGGDWTTQKPPSAGTEGLSFNMDGGTGGGGGYGGGSGRSRTTGATGGPGGGGGGGGGLGTTSGAAGFSGGNGRVIVICWAATV